ncbi:MAG: hypothetical protein L0027_13235, partial [Candidatus Rokubacteria bacterium]|nr:hypothetical protein [Candidatus Rokubacteria bacterium]
MREHVQFYIGGEWVDPTEPRPFDVIDPSTEEPIAAHQPRRAEGRGARRRRGAGRLRRLVAQLAGAAPR